MPDNSTLIDWLSIRLAPDMTRPRFYNLMAQFPNAAAVFEASTRELAGIRGFDLKLATGVHANRATDEVRRHADRLAAGKIAVVTRDDPEYPINLKQSALAPPLLFVKGTLVPEDKYAIAMVGSRHATQYGRGVAREISAGLARYGMTVVSGFARGIDGEAHHAALKAGGRTIAVLGNGMDVCYPAEHRSLVDRVADSGALISEYPLGTPPERYNFPERNHLIAALSLGTLIVEAAKKSGSLITARLALEENRFVFAVPGDITRNNSRGANSLIQQGARMVQRAQDVLVEMKEMLRGYLDEDVLEECEVVETPEKPASRSSKPAKKAAGKDWVDELIGCDDSELEKLVANVQADDRWTENPLTSKTPEQPGVSKKPAVATKRKSPVPTLTADENYILELLRHEAMVFDEIAVHAYSRGIDVPRISAILMKLELRKIIRQLPGRYYVLFV